MSDERIREGREAHRRGDLPAAIAAYGAALAEDARRADVWFLKGVAEHRARLLPQARESLARAVAEGGPQPSFLLAEGGVLHDLGELAGAAERLAAALAAQPRWAPAHLELGRVQMSMGRADAALASFQAAVDVEPANLAAWNELGAALQALARLDDAARAFNHILALDPANAHAHFNVARILQIRGDVARAMEHAQAAVRADEKHLDAWLLLGDLHRRKRESQAATAAFAMAVRADPSSARARNAHAEILAETGQFDAAREAYRATLRLDPASLKAALGAHLTLPQVYASHEHLDRSRREYAEGLERLHEAADGFRFPGAERALAEARWTNFYLAYQGRDDRALQARYGELHRRVLEPAMPELFAPRGRRAPGGRIRVGFASHFFFNCTAGRYFASWVKDLDPQRFEKFVYYTNEWVADDTRSIAAAAQTFRHLPGRSAYAVAQQIAADQLDVLVYPELGMHPETFAMAGLRLAPVQCAGWGHPNTTGLPAIDWYISCGEMEPEGAEAHYSERLARLPGLGTRYAVPGGATGGTRADFGIPEDATAYLVPQSLFKIHPDNDALIAEVLARDARGVAVMFASHHDALTRTFAARLGAVLRARGLDPGKRIRLLEPFLPHGAYLRLNQLCDVMLDTRHWSGGNTSLDALAMGLPVVTLPGELMRGRQSLAMLRTLGVAELVARDADDYVAIAVRLGGDPGERRALSERIVAGHGALFERPEPVAALAEFLASAAHP